MIGFHALACSVCLLLLTALPFTFYTPRQEELNRSISDAGAVALVELVIITYAGQFDDTSNTNDKVWEHVYKEFEELVRKGDLPPSDLRSMAALRKRYALELGVLPCPSHDCPAPFITCRSD